MTTATTEYKDNKKLLWPLASLLSLLPLAGIALYYETGAGVALWLTPIFFYVFIPFIEILFGEDESNPPREAIPALRDSLFYRWSAFIGAPFIYLSWFVGAWFIANEPFSWNVYIATTVTIGLVGAGSLNSGHEVGHRRDKASQFFTRIFLCLCGMGHFRIEHNLGHHVQVATPEDSATAMMGENFYEFVLHELPGGFKRAWAIEKARLERSGLSAFSLQNEVVLNSLITIALYGGMTALFGLIIVPYLLIAALLSNLMLSSANYIEHYGLMRGKRDDGRYERVQPHHSWNANHIVSNVLLLHLQRHSDHHAHAERPYQCLRHFDTSPQLPAGYFTMYLAAWNPFIWFKVMDPLVAKQMNGDMTKAYIKPSKRDAIMQKWHNVEPEISAVAAE